MTERQNTILALLTALLALTALGFPLARHLEDPYPANYHGNLTAWFAMMSENMERAGFAETRLMPPLNPNPAEYPDFRYYLTHPPLDVVLRAGLVRRLGPHEWVIRLQGLVGCFGAALLLWVVARRHVTPWAATAAAAAMAGLPLFQRLGHLSMQHPMTLLCGMAALAAFQRHRETGGRGSAAVMLGALFAGFLFDWPGYFMAALLFGLCLVTRGAARVEKRCAVAFVVAVIVGVAAFFAHAWIVDTSPAELIRTIRNASEVATEQVGFLEGLDRVGAHQLAGYTWGGIGLGALALVALLVMRAPWRTWALWLGLFAYGAMNVLAFPKKAPFHDFWGCYWLPFVGLSAGLAVDAVGRLAGARGRAVAVGLVLGAAGLSVWTHDWEDAATKRGAEHRLRAEQLLAVVPEEDRGLFLTNSRQWDLQILMTYLRVTIVPVEGLPIGELPRRLKELAYHMNGERVLYFLDPSGPEAAVLRPELERVGQPYRALPGFYDLTDFVWK